MNFRNMIGKAVEFKAAVKERQETILDAKVAKANKEIAEQKELAAKLKTIAKAKQLKQENKKKVFDNSTLGKLKANLQENAKKVEQRNEQRPKKKTPNYDPWNIGK